MRSVWRMRSMNSASRPRSLFPREPLTSGLPGVAASANLLRSSSTRSNRSFQFVQYPLGSRARPGSPLLFQSAASRTAARNRIPGREEKMRAAVVQKQDRPPGPGAASAVENRGIAAIRDTMRQTTISLSPSTVTGFICIPSNPILLNLARFSERKKVFWRHHILIIPQKLYSVSREENGEPA